MTNDTEPTPGNASTRLVAALRDVEHLFTHTQMAYLMGMAQKIGYAAGLDEGYRRRVAEENASYPDPQVFDAALIADMAQKQRSRADADADRTQRYAGGPVKPWGTSRPDLADLGPSAARWRDGAGVPLVHCGGEWVWADAA